MNSYIKEFWSIISIGPLRKIIFFHLYFFHWFVDAFMVHLYISHYLFLNLSNIVRKFRRIVQKKTRNEKRKGNSAIGCKYQWQRYISWIIRARRWRKREEGGESTSERAVYVKEEGGKSWKLSEIEHDFFEKRSLAPLWDYEQPPYPPPSLPFVFAIYPSWVPFYLLALSTPKSRWEKSHFGIYQEICNRETRCAVFLASSCAALGSHSISKTKTHYEFFSSERLNGKSDRFL